MVAAAPLKVDWYCSKIAVVNVSNRMKTNAPYSASRCSDTSSAPPEMARRSCGTTTRKKTAHGPAPRARADSSTAGSSRRSVAAVGM